MSSSSSIVGSASQKWQLFILFSEIVGQFIPDDYEPWEAYLALRQVTDIIFASTITRHMLTELKHGVQQFLKLYAKLYGTASITPKFHYLIHYHCLIAI